MKPVIKTVEEEAQWIFELHNNSLKDSLQLLSAHFITIQTRNQLLLTLGTVTLTITGFSGPRIAESSPLAMTLLVVGLVFMIGALIMLLGTGMKLKWVTQFEGKTPQEILIQVIHYRNQKSTVYQWQLRAMMLGLGFYVGSLITFFLK